MRKCFLLIFTFLLTYSLHAQEEARLLRFPAIYNNQIVFSYAGDLYTVQASGGTARRITSHTGYEMFPHFSPDGRTIAFTAQYDGNTEVYSMPAEGGVPKRLTYTATLDRDDVSDRMGPNNIVMGWRGNDSIIFRSRMIEPNDFIGQLFLVSANGSMANQLPLPRGGFCSYSPDFTKLAYNRVFREFRTWKRYRGGQADDIWIYDFNTKKTENITNNPAQDICPMWYKDKIYFISDRDGHLNLFVYDITAKETKQLTKFDNYDIKFPSLGNNAIVFENGGYIYKFDLETGKYDKVTIYLNEDFAAGRGGLTDVSKSITNFEISPDGNRALFGARGDIFTVPVKNGNARNLTNTSGVHERSGKFSPNGKYAAYISDASGEDEIYIEDQMGKEKPVQLTSDKGSYKFQIVWSPDSKKIAYSDRDQKLYFVDIESKKITNVAKSDIIEMNDYSWSPDSKWIVYSLPQTDGMTKIFLYSLEKKENYQVTDNWYNSYAPVFSSNGKYLYFVSDRTFSPRYGETEFNHIYLDMSKLYMLTLSKEIKSPFEPLSDEVTVKEDKKSAEEKKDKKESQVSVNIDLENINNRILELPVPAGNYFHITSVGDKIYYQKNSSADPRAKLCLFDLEKKKETELGDVNGYEISADQKKILVAAAGGYAILDLPSAKIDVKEKLDLSGLKVNLDRKAEWNEIFNECWRQMRDFFYAPNMHGLNWVKIKEKYQPLVKYVNNRADLTYIIGEMIGEINVGHAYVGGGDYPKAERINLGLLGAKLVQDSKSGYYKITKILNGENWNPSLRSPLTEIGVNVKEGEYIIAVDGRAVNSVNNIFELLTGKADKQVTLTINSSPNDKGSRDVVIVPIGNEQQLYYYNWVQTNIEKVNKASNGEVGYIHIPDMGPAGLNQFSKLYYPQLRKKALIIDDRGNGGGNVSPMITERLLRQPVMLDISRNGSLNYNPGGMHVGPKVLLLNEFSASDGDIFPYRFKFYKLGKTIGKRSWGGVVGIRGTLPILDGGYLNRPEFSRFDLDGKWNIEGHGVDPDIYVDNDPATEFGGTDQQLDRAMEEIMKELKNNPPKEYKIPDYPDKSK